MKKLLSAIALLVFAINSNAQTDSANYYTRELLEVMGSAKMGVQVINGIIESYKKTSPDVPVEFWEDFKKEVRGEDLVNLVIPIYIKHYSIEDLKGLIKFYKSDLGQKVIKTLPAVSQESFLIGSEWGKEIANKVMERMKTKGYIKEI